MKKCYKLEKGVRTYFIYDSACIVIGIVIPLMGSDFQR